MKTTNSIRISKGPLKKNNIRLVHTQKNKQTKNNHHKLTVASFKSVDSYINDSYSFCCSSQQRSDGADVKFSVLKTHRVSLKGDLKNQADPSVTRAKKLHCCNNYVKINPPRLFHQKKKKKWIQTFSPGPKRKHGCPTEPPFVCDSNKYMEKDTKKHFGSVCIFCSGPGRQHDKMRSDWTGQKREK